MNTKDKTYIIAEVGSTHDGSLGNLLNLIKLCKKNGADAVKMQTHIPEFETIRNAPRPSYFKSEDRYEYFKRTSFNYKQYIKIIHHCKKIKIDFISSPFSIEAYNFLKKLGVKKIKIASGEINNLPLLQEINKSKNQIFLSTGMSNYKEIDFAIKNLNKQKLTIMQCTSDYPCKYKNVGINVINDFLRKYKSHMIGFSDHTIGEVAAILAVYSGAKVIEKHVTLSKHMYGSDAKFSMNPDEFSIFCKKIRDAEEIIYNRVNKNKLSKNQVKMREIFQKGIYLKTNLNKNTRLKKEHLSFKKPSKGIPAKDYLNVIGKYLKLNKSKNKVLKLSDLKNEK